MKKLFILLAVLSSLLVASATAQAGECFSDPVYDRDWNAVVTTGAYVRDVACMEGSEVKTTLSVGTVVHVIAETDGWYEIETSEGTVGWVGQGLVEETDEVFHEWPFSDIEGHQYEAAILYAYEAGIVQGYDNGTYGPDGLLNRAELLKIIVVSAYEDESLFEPYSDTECFNDVDPGLWYTKYVCFAKDRGIVEGYGDDSFHPSSDIAFVEALKITMIGFDFEYEEGDPWYSNILAEAESNDFVPPDVTEPTQNFTRGQMAELVMRIMESQ